MSELTACPHGRPLVVGFTCDCCCCAGICDDDEVALVPWERFVLVGGVGNGFPPAVLIGPLFIDAQAACCAVTAGLHECGLDVNGLRANGWTLTLGDPGEDITPDGELHDVRSWTLAAPDGSVTAVGVIRDRLHVGTDPEPW